MRDTAPVSCPGSPEARLAYKQISIVHSTVENQAAAQRTAVFLTKRDNRPGEVSLYGTRSPGQFVPSPGQFVPNQPAGTVRPGAPGQSDRVRVSR